MKILLTNDDSHRSPLLEIALDYFSTFADVVMVVPEHEQSWMGKKITRFEPVCVREIELFGRKAFSVSGSPADCSIIGIYHLLGGKPDVVVSGINAGFNLGVPFMFSSGTIGAGLEANIAGVPAIALSQAFDSATRNQYVDDYLLEKDTIARFREQTTKVLDKIVGVLLAPPVKDDFLRAPITWSVNFPFKLKGPDLLSWAELGIARYGNCFSEQPGLPSKEGVRVFQHALHQAVRDPNPSSDGALLDQGISTVSAINMWQFSAVREYDSLVERVRSSL